MRRSTWSLAMGLVALALTCGPTLAADQWRAAPAPGAPAAPLKGDIRVTPAPQRGGRPIVAQVSFSQLDQKLTEFRGGAQSYEQGSQRLLAVKKTCTDKAYTVQDQKAAGCTGTDTMNQCMDKLYKHCVQTYSTPATQLPGSSGVGGLAIDGASGPPLPGTGAQIPGFSTKDYLQNAAATATRARALSQMLTQYAFQVEQNAKALAPAPVRAR